MYPSDVFVDQADYCDNWTSQKMQSASNMGKRLYTWIYT